MRFKIKPQPKPGNTRTQSKFAWLPITINQTVVWLESYIANEKYIAGDGWYEPPCWVETSLALIERKE